MFYSFVHPEILNPAHIVRKLSNIAPEDYEWVERMIRPYFSEDKLSNRNIIAILGSIKVNRPWVKNKDLESFIYLPWLKDRL